jgi:hypothetical protein
MATTEWEGDQRAKGIWCIVARVSRKGPQGQERRLGYDNFTPGTQVYCLPPTRKDDDAEVRTLGYGGRFHRLVDTTMYAKHLNHWTAEYVTDPRLMKELSPPWDGKEDSQVLAFSVAQSFAENAPWPIIELRDWNRTRAQRMTGGPTWFAQLRQAVAELLGGGKKKKRKSKPPPQEK